MRAATYARYSTDRQRDTSIEDQLRNCDRAAERHGFEICARFDDRAISGSDRHRPGYQRMLSAARAQSFDVLIIDDLSRLSRDDVETKTTLRLLKHLGIRVLAVSDGYDSSARSAKIQAGVRGLINEIYLDDLAEKTHRGLAGQVTRGMSAGGISYGYRSVVAGESGHRLEIDAEAAEWVRWIYRHYADGWSSQRIAHELNRLGVRSPRSSTWAVSGIYGSRSTGVGILNNELYIGRYIWNRSQWVKDPETGKRRRIPRPESEWMVQERPELQIVELELWHAVRARMGKLRVYGGSHGKGAMPRTLFGGLLRCGCGVLRICSSVLFGLCGAGLVNVPLSPPT